MVRYPFDLLRAVSQVEPLTTNGKSEGYGSHRPFALRYRRVNGTFYQAVSQVEPLTTNEKSEGYGSHRPFALRYRRV